MNWDAISAASDLLGAGGVILTLAYLARQIAQTNSIGRAAVVRELQERYHELYELVASNIEVAELAARLTAPDYRAQSEVEEQRMQNLAQLVAGMYFGAQTAYDQGQMEADVYTIYCEDVEARLLQWPALKFYLRKVISRWPTAAKAKILAPIFS
jgi:ketosteroid isomerase-like protein